MTHFTGICALSCGRTSQSPRPKGLRGFRHPFFRGSGSDNFPFLKKYLLRILQCFKKTIPFRQVLGAETFNETWIIGGFRRQARFFRRGLSFFRRRLHFFRRELLKVRLSVRSLYKRRVFGTSPRKAKLFCRISTSYWLNHRKPSTFRLLPGKMCYFFRNYLHFQLRMGIYNQVG